MVTYLRFHDLKARGIINSWPMVTRRVERDGFPPGQKLGPNTRVWREDEVQAWLDSRPVVPRRGRPRKGEAPAAEGVDVDALRRP
jgi:hypothetical protein